MASKHAKRYTPKPQPPVGGQPGYRDRQEADEKDPQK